MIKCVFDFNYRDDDKFLAHSLVGIKKIDKIMAEDLNIDLLIDLTESTNIIDNSIGNSNYQFLLRKVRNYTEIEELKLIPSPRNY